MYTLTIIIEGAKDYVLLARQLRNAMIRFNEAYMQLGPNIVSAKIVNEDRDIILRYERE